MRTCKTQVATAPRGTASGAALTQLPLPRPPQYKPCTLQAARGVTRGEPLPQRHMRHAQPITVSRIAGLSSSTIQQETVCVQFIKKCRITCYVIFAAYRCCSFLVSDNFTGQAGPGWRQYRPGDYRDRFEGQKVYLGNYLEIPTKRVRNNNFAPP